MKRALAPILLGILLFATLPAARPVTGAGSGQQQSCCTPQLQTCWVRLNDAPTDYPTVQAAVEASSAPSDVVKVAGHCAGVEQHAGLTQTVYLRKTLTIQGGYTVTNWTDPDPIAYPTTLDAQGEGRVLLITGDVTPTLAGLRLTGGDALRAGPDPYGQGRGGGIYVLQAAAAISGCLFYSNTADAGGGIYTYDSYLTMQGNTLTYNTVQLFGGGVFMNEGAGRLEGNTFFSNTAGIGAGAYFASEAITLTNNGFLSNTAIFEGGGLVVEIYGGHSELVGNVVSGNRAVYNGGGLYFGEEVRGPTDLPPLPMKFGPLRLQAIFYRRGRRDRREKISRNSMDSETIKKISAFSALSAVKSFPPEQLCRPPRKGQTSWGDRMPQSGYVGEPGFPPPSLSGKGAGGLGLYAARAPTDLPPWFPSRSGMWKPRSDHLLFAGNVIEHNWTGGNGGGVYTGGDGGAADFVGNTVRDNEAGADGGGIYVDRSAEPTPILSNTVAANVAGRHGGGIYLGPTTATVQDNVIRDNSAGGAGGGGYGQAVWSDNQFIQNVAVNGGGIYGSGRLEGNAVISNSAYYGGGMYLEGESGLCVLTANDILSNSVSMIGGGIYAVSGTVVLAGNTVVANHADAYYGGGLHLIAATAVLTDNEIVRNTAREGGGLYLYQGSATLTANTIADNQASSCGGGLAAYENALSLRNDRIAANAAPWGAGLWIGQNSDALLINNWVVENQAESAGSGLLIWRSHARIVHTTLVGNGGQSNTAVVVHGDVPPMGTAALTDTILLDHAVGITVAAGCTATLEATLWGNDIDWAGDGTIYTGTVNVWGDAAFRDPDAGDYHIGVGSAALDAGIDAGVTTDIDGDPRPLGAGYDLGADEAPWEPIWRIYLPLLGRGGGL